MYLGEGPEGLPEIGQNRSKQGHYRSVDVKR